MKVIVYKSFTLLFFISIQCSICEGQNNYESGYVITLQGDTLLGKVKDRTPEPFGELFEKIRFKEKGKLLKKFKANQLKGYKIDKTVFESLWLTEKPILKWPVLNKTSGDGQFVFMKVVHKGKVNYYHHEFRDEDSGYYDFEAYLRFASYPTLERINLGIFTNRKKKLINFFQNCPVAVEQIKEDDNISILKAIQYYESSCQ